MADEIPRLFQLRTGPHLADHRGDGVLWLDGTATINWVDATGHTARVETYASLEVLGAEVESDGLTVVWLRQDTYTDQEV